jgi:cardiolipin synthase
MATRVRPKLPARRPSAGERIVFAPEERADAVLGVIGSARRRLILSLFRCDDFRVLDALVEALKRKVDVRILLTGRAKGWKKRLGELWSVLESTGAQLCRYADPVVKYHAKYIVADDGPALVASLNFTHECFTSTCDFLLTTHDRGVVSGLKKLFVADCCAPGGSLPEELSSRLIVGPQQARRQFTRLIEQAKRSILIIDPKLTDPEMLALLKEKRASGVVVKVVGRGLRGGFAPHGKMMVIDESTGVIGSLSLSALSLDFRREVAVIVRDRQAVGQLNYLFQSLTGGGAAVASTLSKESAP